MTYVEVGGDGNNGVGDLLTKVRLSNLLHLAKDHGRDFFGSELLVGTINLDLDNGLALLVDDLVGEVLHVRLDILVGELATNESPKEQLVHDSQRPLRIGRCSVLDIVDGVSGVGGGLVLGGVTDEAFLVGKGDV